MNPTNEQLIELCDALIISYAPIAVTPGQPWVKQRNDIYTVVTFARQVLKGERGDGDIVRRRKELADALLNAAWLQPRGDARAALAAIYQVLEINGIPQPPSPRADSKVHCQQCSDAAGLSHHLEGSDGPVYHEPPVCVPSPRVADVCGVCAGEETLSGDLCICKGAGTQTAEVEGLREYILRLEKAAYPNNGWKLVPTEPTDEMKSAIRWQIGKGVVTWGTADGIYKAALEVAPTPNDSAAASPHEVKKT